MLVFFAQPTLSSPFTVCKTDRYLWLLGALTLAAALTAVDATLRSRQAAPRLTATTALVRDLGLTDLALFTEARYTRHLSQADWHTAFQDHPFAFEHFPSGSLHVPPHLLRPTDASLAAETEVPR
jgi:hypothetical protein